MELTDEDRVAIPRAMLDADPKDYVNAIFIAGKRAGMLLAADMLVDEFKNEDPYCCVHNAGIIANVIRAAANPPPQTVAAPVRADESDQPPKVT